MANYIPMASFDSTPADRELLVTQALLAEAHGLRKPSIASDPGLYACGCGLVFQAPVTTHVECPRCHNEVPW